MQLLHNKTAIITGAARGIGRSIALLFAQQGANIAFTYVSDSSAAAADELTTACIVLGVHCKAFQTNAADFAACETMVNEILADEKFGKKIDICVNNAGISKDNLLLRMTPEQWSEVLQTNLGSVYNMTKLVMRPMMKARQGSIINMSSIIGIMGNAGQSSYAASKAGVIAFTKSMAKELGSRNIRCNAIAPGFVETDMTSYLNDGDQADKYKSNIPLGRFGKGADIANAALYFASDMSAYVTGQTLNVCGGLLT